MPEWPARCSEVAALHRGQCRRRGGLLEVSLLEFKIHVLMWRGAIGIKQVYRALRSLVRLPAMDDFSKDGFSGNHVSLISVLICIIFIDKSSGNFCRFTASYL